MADIEAPVATPIAESPKKAAKKEKKAKTARPKSSHPSTAVMVNAAIESLKERGGSSLQAVKKYMSSTYKIDAEKMSPFIKKYLKSAVVSGALIQTKGKGASGSFKLASAAVTKTTVAKPKKATRSAEKAVTPKKTVAKKIKTKKSPKKAAPSKAKKTAKVPTKPKSPKSKIAKSRAAKKASAK